MKIEIEIPDKYAFLIKAYMQTFGFAGPKEVFERLILEVFSTMDKHMAPELREKIERELSQ